MDCELTIGQYSKSVHIWLATAKQAIGRCPAREQAEDVGVARRRQYRQGRSDIEPKLNKTQSAMSG